MSENNNNYKKVLGKVPHLNNDISKLEEDFKNLLTRETKLKQEHLNLPIKFLSSMDQGDRKFMGPISDEHRKEYYQVNTFVNIKPRGINKSVQLFSFIETYRPKDSELSIEAKRLIITRTFSSNTNPGKTVHGNTFSTIMRTHSPINNQKYTRSNDITPDSDIHTKAYLKFLYTIGKSKNNGSSTEINSFIKLLMTLTYFSMLRDIDYNKLNIDNLIYLYKNIARIHSKIHITDKYKHYKYYDEFVSPIIKESVNILLHTLSNKYKEYKVKNKKRLEQSDSKIITYYLFFVNEIYFYNRNSYDKLMSKNKLEDVKNSIIVYTKKIGIDKNKSYLDIKSIAEKSTRNKLSGRELNELKSLKHVEELSKEVEKFKEIYQKIFKSNSSDLKKITNKLEKSYVTKLLNREGFNTSKNNYYKAASIVKKRVIDDLMRKHIQHLEANNITNKNEYNKSLRNYKMFYIDVSNADDLLSKSHEQFEKKLRTLQNSTIKKQINKANNLKNLKNQYILNIKQNGTNSIPNNKELQEKFKNKPAYLREILRLKRGSSSSSSSAVYKDEINYFKKMGKYKPLTSYENRFLPNYKPIDELEKQIKKLESKKNTTNNNKKIINNKKEELKKLKKLYNDKMSSLKSGLINKRKGINIDTEANSIRKKYQSELLDIGKKYLEDLWKSYYNSLTKKGTTFNETKIRNQYMDSKKKLQKNYGNGFINKYSSPIYKQIVLYKKFLQGKMEQLRKDVIKSKSPKRRIKLVRKK